MSPRAPYPRPSYPRPPYPAAPTPGGRATGARSGPTGPQPVRRLPVGTHPAAPRPTPRRPVTPVPLAPTARRLRGGFAAVLVVLLVIGGRLVQLQGVGASRLDRGVPVSYAALADKQRVVQSSLPAVRGSITDRNGSPLAVAGEARAVYGDPKAVAAATCPTDPARRRPCTAETIAAALAPVIGADPAVLAAKLGNSRLGFVYLGRGLEPAVGARVRALNLLGIGVLPESRRVHPAHELAANVLGFTSPDGAGLAGIEYALDGVLRGRDGKRTAEYDKAGRTIPTGPSSTEQPVDGRDVQLTLNRDLQWEAQRAVAAKVAGTGAASGSAVVLDVRTGEVLALATAPGFDPDNRKGVPASALGNPAVSDVYEPGSVAKVMTAAAALEAGVTTPGRVITVPNELRRYGKTFHDAETHGTEHLTFTGVLAHSSNVGTIQIAEELGPQRLFDAFRRFGIGSPSGLGLPGESGGSLRPISQWSGTSLPTIAIGQGVSANAVQVASVFATVANDGVRVTPSILRSVTGPDGRPVPSAPPESHRVVSPQVAAQLRTMLEAVVSAEGTAPLAAIPGYRTAGKTGTAQRVVNGRYLANNYSSSFVGFAPADAPRLVTAVVLQGTGGRDYFGGSVAGPVFKDVMSFALRSERIPPTGTTFVLPQLSADGPR